MEGLGKTYSRSARPLSCVSPSAPPPPPPLQTVGLVPLITLTVDGRPLHFSLLFAFKQSALWCFHTKLSRSFFTLLLRPSCWPSVKASASRAEDSGFESRLRRDFTGHTSDLKIGTPVATAPGQTPG